MHGSLNTFNVFSNFAPIMRPDYPHKLFGDHRNSFVMLMEALALESK
jgi:hypothetical protein